MKKQVLIILWILLVPCVVWAQQYSSQQPSFGAVAPSATFRSTSGAYMATGSAYSTTVHQVGAYSPVSAPAQSGPRRSGFNDITTGEATGEGGYDPSNPNLPIGDAILPLLLMALTFVGITYTRRKKTEN